MSTLCGLFGTILIIILASYFRNIKFDIQLHKKILSPNNGGIMKYSINLFYTGNMPIILFIAFINNIIIISQNLSLRYPKVPLVKLLGVWKNVGENTGKNLYIELLFCIIIDQYILFSKNRDKNTDVKNII